MNLKSTYIIIGAMAVSISAAAQDLSTEVVVDRTVAPEERAATRPAGLSPVLVMPRVSQSGLSRQNYTGLSDLTRSYSRLDPAAGALAAEPTPYKGYAAIGYFPTLNLGASAGYRFLDNEKFSLGAAFQLNGESYKEKYGDLKATKSNKAWDALVGVDFGWKANSKSLFTAALDYNYISHESLFFTKQNTNAFGLDLGWKSKAFGLDYHAAAGFGYEKSGESHMTVFDDENIFLGTAQTRFTAAIGASKPFAETSRIGLDLKGDFLRTSFEEMDGGNIDPFSVGTISIKPYYALAMDRVSATVGLNVNLGTGDNGKVHVAPDIRVEWAPTGRFAAWVSAGGGDVLNPFSTLRQYSVFSPIGSAYRRSNIPLILEGGLNFGPFTGFTAEVYGGWAKANKWLMLTNYYGFGQMDITGWHAGLRLGYTRSIFSVSAKAEIAPSDWDKAWIYNRDRAKYILGGELTVRPFDRLEAGVGYEFRGHRYYTSDPDEHYSLGCVSDLSVRASYRVLPWLTVFARGENLLGRRHLLLPYVQSNTVHGAIGLAAKF